MLADAVRPKLPVVHGFSSAPLQRAKLLGADPTQRILTRAENNTKTAKQAEALGVHASILHLAPNVQSGYQTCPFASAGCAAACLYSAGRGGFTSTQVARIRKTRRFFEQPEGFLAQLVSEIELQLRRARQRGHVAAVRLNGTSDIDWGRHRVWRGDVNFPHVFAAFPEVQFYDYTKRPAAFRQARPANHHLTFSLSEGNDRHAVEALAAGLNVAVVLRAGSALPATWGGFPTVDGDEHDYRFLDPEGGHVVVLRAKGAAKKDTSGFVREVGGGFEVGRDLRLAVAA